MNMIEHSSSQPSSNNETILIYMPTFARNFSEGMITDEALENFNYVIVEWLESKLHDMYINT